MTASEPCGAESMIMSMIIGKAVWSIPRDNEDSVFGAAGARCGLVPGPFVSASSEGESEVEEVPEGVGTAAVVSADDVGLSRVVGLVGVVGSVAVETAEVAVILALICPGNGGAAWSALSDGESWLLDAPASKALQCACWRG